MGDILNQLENYNILKNMNVYIFGTGKAGKTLCKLLSILEIHIVGFLDNDSEKQGNLLFHIPIYSPETILTKNKDEIAILIASMYVDDISKQVESMGFSYGVNYWNGLNMKDSREKGTVSSFYKDDIKKRDELLKKILKRVDSGISLVNALIDESCINHGERVAEYAFMSWWLNHNTPAHILDVGCVLNNPIIDPYISTKTQLSFLNPSQEVVLRKGATFHIKKLEDYITNEKYDLVTCLSTLEHIGFDNTRYGIEDYDKNWGWDECILQFGVLVEILISFVGNGGKLLISCPYGKKEFVCLPPIKGKRTAQVICSEHIDELNERMKKYNDITMKSHIFRLENKGWIQTDKVASFESYGTIGPGASGVVIFEITKNHENSSLELFTNESNIISRNNIPGRIKVSETSKARETLEKYCIGDGIDIGYGGDPIVPSAICMDLPEKYASYKDYTQHLHGDAKNLKWFKDESLDYVYSSHVLEDFEDTYSVIDEWLRIIKINGVLVLFLPDEQAYRQYCSSQGKKPNPHHTHLNFSLEYIKDLLKNRRDIEIIHENYPVAIYSFELVIRKISYEK